MDKISYHSTWCRALRDQTVKRERKGRTKRSQLEKFDDWLWSDETNICTALKPDNIEICYHDSIGRVTKRIVTAEALISKGGGKYLKAWCHEKQAERTFRISDIGEIVVLDTGEVFFDILEWVLHSTKG